MRWRDNEIEASKKKLERVTDRSHESQGEMKRINGCLIDHNAIGLKNLFFLNKPSCGGEKWSGKRDSNSRLPPWQGGALPTELFPLCLLCVKQVRNSNEVRLGVKPNHAHRLSYLQSSLKNYINMQKNPRSCLAICFSWHIIRNLLTTYKGGDQ